MKGEMGPVPSTSYLETTYLKKVDWVLVGLVFQYLLIPSIYLLVVFTDQQYLLTNTLYVFNVL